MKTWKWILVGVIALIIFILLKRPEGNNGKLLKFLDDKRLKLETDIDIINKRREKRKELIKIIKEEKIKRDKKINRMSNDELADFINKHRG